MFFYLIFFFQWTANALPWLAPMVLSTVTGSIAGYGSYRFGQGELKQRLKTLEADVKEGQEQFVTRNEFDLLREDLRDIKRDVREIRRSVTR